MRFDIQAEDRQFVTSTGANATPDARTTRFDGAPEASTGLVITPLADDPNPRLFEVGDSYDLSWDGNSILNATVVRSDAAGEGGIVGFSGTDANGDPALVLWTPDFDLQGWYESVGGRASFYTSDRQASYTHGYVCFASEARIETSYGSMPAGCLKPGHRVLTRDAGPRLVRWVGRKRVPGHGQGAPIRFASGLRLSQQHRVMITSARADVLFGSAEVLVPAKALTGQPGVRLEPCMIVEYVHVLLERHHILTADGVPCESLFVGPHAMSHVDVPPDLVGQVRHSFTVRPVLSYREALLVMDQTIRWDCSERA